MLTFNPWQAVLRRTLIMILVAALLGWLTGALFFWLFVATGLLLAWHLLHLYRLERWLSRQGYVRHQSQFPSPDSVWSGLYGHIISLKQRNRKRKRKLTRLLKQFRRATTALPSAVVVLNSRQEVDWCNNAARSLLGLRSPQDIGQPITSLLRHPYFIEYIANRRDTGQEWSEDDESGVEIPAPVGNNMLLTISVTPYGKKQQLLLATDISRLHRLEQTRQDFIANVSHELRTPLTVVSGYLEALLDSGDDCTLRWQQPLSSMQAQTGRMQSIIEDLLLLSRLETQASAESHPVAVTALLETIVEDARSLSGEQRHDLQLDTDPNLALVGSEQELRSAFSNLVFNAVHYSPAGSTIWVRWFRRDDSLLVEIQDQGEGIPPHLIPRITERFFRVDRSRSSREVGSGSGLGLAIVKHVLQRHDGILEIDSQLSSGSVFRCRFPFISRGIANDKALADPA